ncbi:prenyltransferase/squalene oxidase repeat-containing protein [Actinomadura viridis]|uniref:prenyltransferase/squalene oxidase repeat-containing protein n=1 Tax=Actinomadura viridis TaxID=58110 RepID=UPI0036A2FE08
MSIDAVPVHGEGLDDPSTYDVTADADATAHALMDELLLHPWGQVSPSVYETGRLVRLAPWLAGHEQRVRFLLATQRPDGGWGGPGGYALVPTLSATEALLTLLRHPGDDPIADTSRASVAGAAGRGLDMLIGFLGSADAQDIPDMPALDLIASSLIRSINQLLSDSAASRPAPLAPRWRDTRLHPPAWLDGARLAAVRAAIASGADLPSKVFHALETAGEKASRASIARLPSTGGVGASPAATAAWLDERTASDPRHPARVFLETVVENHAGLAPCGIPITTFERAWVLRSLARAGLAPDIPSALVRSLEASAHAGMAAAEGLPADADTTSVALYALALVGAPCAPDALWSYETDTHFCTWKGEQGFSTTVNAHVLEAFGQYLEMVEAGSAGHTKSAPRYRATRDKLVALLCDHQEADGRWLDRWHASPYYATACCALALARFGGEHATPALRRARRWVVDTQRPDGSWGIWAGTAEESAYALQILAQTRPGPAEDSESIARGHRFLLRAAGDLRDQEFDGPALWHDKDLYLPSAIVRAEILGTLRTLQRHHLGTKVC